MRMLSPTGNTPTLLYSGSTFRTHHPTINSTLQSIIIYIIFSQIIINGHTLVRIVSPPIDNGISSPSIDQTVWNIRLNEPDVSPETCSK